MNEPAAPTKGWGWMPWTCVVVVTTLAAASILSVRKPVLGEMAHQTSVMNNARQIIMALKIYAQENGDVYPDSKVPGITTANQALRQLIIEDVLQDERIFGAKISPFVPDGNIGPAPGFKQALQPGENHWAMIAGQTLKSPGYFPLLLENPLDSSWPPKWQAGSAGNPERARIWSADKIIIGRNDNRVNLEKLVKKDGILTFHEKLFKPQGQEPIPPVMKVLNVE